VRKRGARKPPQRPPPRGRVALAQRLLYALEAVIMLRVVRARTKDGGGGDAVRADAKGGQQAGDLQKEWC
jgi:hypothetical protein